MKKQLTFLVSLTFLFLFLTGFSLGGFVDDLRFKGTSVGITKCIERNKQEGVPRSVIKKRCINDNQKKFKNNVLDGNYEYSLIESNTRIEKYIINRSPPPIPLGSSGGRVPSGFSQFEPYIKSDFYEKYCVRKEISSNERVGYVKNDSCNLYTWSGKSRFSGTVENKTNDKIITHLEIHINHKDSPDTNKLLYDVWILPKESFGFNEKELVFQPKRDRLYSGEGSNKEFFYSSSIENVKGVDFVLK